MSELKAHRILGIDEECATVENNYYLKSEADKYIGELKAHIHGLESMPHTDNSAVIERLSNENERLNKELTTWIQGAANQPIAISKLREDLRHHKYKRCLDKVKWCDERIARYTLQQGIQGISRQREIKFYRRLKDKFIEISKRFGS